MTNHNNKIDISVILPCLNEEKAIESCLRQLEILTLENSYKLEVIIVDNNSTDSSPSILSKMKEENFPFEFKVVKETIRGYGSAYQKGLSIARGKYLIMVDLDGTYDFFDIPKFIEKLQQGFDLVVGNRFINNKKLGSMPWHHRYIGNPLLSGIVRLLFKIKIRDIHCGIRAITLTSLKKITLRTSGMEFASEMIIKSAKNKLSITEIPVIYKERIGKSKLNTFQDGWRHLRFILLYSPLVIFLIPGTILFVLGVILMSIQYFINISIFNIHFYIHPMFLFSSFIIIGYQLIFFAFFAKIYSIIHMSEKNEIFEKMFKYITIEKAGIAGLIMSLFGIGIYIFIFYNWINSNMGPLEEEKNALIGLTSIILGVQTVASAFMLSIIGIKETK